MLFTADSPETISIAVQSILLANVRLVILLQRYYYDKRDLSWAGLLQKKIADDTKGLFSKGKF